MSEKIFEIVAVVIIALLFCFLIKGYMDCDGEYVRGLFWMECIN